MRFSKILGLLVTFVLIISLFSLIWKHRFNSYSEYSSAQATNMKLQEQDKKSNNPCWFRTREGLESASYEMIKKRQDREMYGYETDIPISEGTRMFNEELQCSPLFRMYPALTEEDLIGAIVAKTDSGSQEEVAKAQKDILWKIATDKKLPKASLLHFGGGEEGMVVYLSLQIDSVHGHKAIKPEQIFVIRKDISGVEVVK